MLEFWNVLAAFLAGLVAGLALHSAWRHTFNGKEVKDEQEAN